MSVYMDRVYSSYSETPGEFELVGKVDINHPAWDFDIAMVVEHNGELRWFSDSGCSCPSPFEYQSWEDGNPDLDQLWEWLNEQAEDSWHDITTADVVDLQRMVHHYQSTRN